MVIGDEKLAKVYLKVTDKIIKDVMGWLVWQGKCCITKKLFIIKFKWIQHNQNGEFIKQTKFFHIISYLFQNFNKL